jgi:hypothetical protein
MQSGGRVGDTGGQVGGEKDDDPLDFNDFDS